jgi:lipase ATG15
VTTSTLSHSITSPPAMPTSTSTPTPDPPTRHKSHCVRRSWFGFCKEWSTNYEWRQEI